MSIKITDYRKSCGHGQKSIWFIFCLLEALTIKQTGMGLDFLNMHFEGNDLFQLFRG